MQDWGSHASRLQKTLYAFFEFLAKKEAEEQAKKEDPANGESADQKVRAQPTLPQPLARATLATDEKSEARIRPLIHVKVFQPHKLSPTPRPARN